MAVPELLRPQYLVDSASYRMRTQSRPGRNVCERSATGMSLLLYFKTSSDTTKLPDPRGPLSTTVPIVVHRISKRRSEASDQNRSLRVVINEKEAIEHTDDIFLGT